MNRCSKPSAVYSTIDYSNLHETAIVLHTDVLAASMAASSDIAACLPTSDWGRAVNYGRFCLPTESRMATTVNQP